MGLQDFIGEAGIWSIFGAPKISIDEIYQLEKSSPNLLIYSLPAVAAFTLLEYIFSSRDGKAPNYEMQETLGSIFIGMGNLLVNMGLKLVLLYGAIWVYNITPWRMGLNWWLLIPCFIVYDFCSFWAHRVSHYCRFFWATHVVHHSAEHYNLTVSFRQSWVQHLKLVFFFPLIMMGFHPVIFFVSNQLSVLYQFWVHTESIKKLHPFIEKYFGTPSNHRVHHGVQGKYLDRNFGATFMIWDHWFGSFQYEEEKPVYGITTGVESKINPFTLNFQEYKEMFQDVKQARGIGQKLYFVFASPAKISQTKKAMAASSVISENVIQQTEFEHLAQDSAKSYSNSVENSV